MACGLPVVASPVGINRDVVEPGTNGFLASSTEDWVRAFEAFWRGMLISEGKWEPTDDAASNAISQPRWADESFCRPSDQLPPASRKVLGEQTRWRSCRRIVRARVTAAASWSRSTLSYFGASKTMFASKTTGRIFSVFVKPYPQCSRCSGNTTSMQPGRVVWHAFFEEREQFIDVPSNHQTCPTKTNPSPITCYSPTWTKWSLWS